MHVEEKLRNAYRDGCLVERVQSATTGENEGQPVASPMYDQGAGTAGNILLRGPVAA